MQGDKGDVGPQGIVGPKGDAGAMGPKVNAVVYQRGRKKGGRRRRGRRKCR